MTERGIELKNVIFSRNHLHVLKEVSWSAESRGATRIEFDSYRYIGVCEVSIDDHVEREMSPEDYRMLTREAMERVAIEKEREANAKT